MPVASDTPTVSDVQKRLEGLGPSDDKYRPLLHELLSHQDLKLHIHGLDGPGLEELVELLDRALDRIPVTDDDFRKTLRRLQSICSNREVLPRSHIIQNDRLLDKGQPVAAGGFADVHEAKLDGKKVCVKALRLYLQDTAGPAKKIFYREVVVWKRLQHPNIVPFLGVPSKVPPFEIICEWMENDRITEYARKHPEVNPVDLLWDVVDGLHFLHSSNIVHGDLKGANILIDEKGRARLTDFGLASIILGEKSLISPQDPTATNATTWAAPEILGGAPVSKEGDVFTFAMVAVETFTGSPPFVMNFHAAILEILNGKRPPRPAALRHEGLWEIMEECWSQAPKKRPTTSQLLEFFRKSFKRGRETPKVEPLPRASSTWTLVAAEVPMVGGTGHRPDQLRQGTVDGDEQGPQDPSTTVAQTVVTDSQPDPPIQDRENHPPQTRKKSSRFKRSVKKVKNYLKKLFGRKTPN